MDRFTISTLKSEQFEKCDVSLDDVLDKIVSAFEECMCRLRNIAMGVWQTTDKVIPMCRCASQATQKLNNQKQVYCHILRNCVLAIQKYWKFSNIEIVHM